MIKNYRRDSTGSNSNLDVTLSNQLSVVVDPFLLNSFHEILYVTYNGAKWRVSSVDIQYPKMILDFGGLYKEESE